MGFKSRNIFGAQLNRNFKAGSKIADNVTKSLLLGGLVGADYIQKIPTTSISIQTSDNTRKTRVRRVRTNIGDYF